MPNKVCIEHFFNPLTNISHRTPQKSGKTVSNVIFQVFWGPQTKMKPHGEFIMWTDSQCNGSMQWAFKNHLKINQNVPPSAHLFAFETEASSFAPMKRSWFLSRCNKI